MSLLVQALAVAGGVLGGLWVGRSRAPAGEKGEGMDEVERDSVPPDPANEPAAAGEAVDWSLFPCALGDVVVRAVDGAEAWLAGALVLREDAPAAVLFIAPDARGAGGERAILAWPRPRTDVAWLSPVPPGSLVVGAEPPSAIEIGGARFERTRRLPLRLQRVGTGAPDVGPTGIVGEYRASSGEVALVVAADGVARAWRGKMLGEGEVDVWGGSKRRA